MRNLNVRKQTSTMVEKNSSQLSSRLIKVKGQLLNLITGQNDTKIVIPADGSQILGIAFSNTFTGDFSLIVNNEIIHDKIASIFAVPSPLGALGLQPFFPINRSLGGRDDISLSLNNSGAPAQVSYVVYYK